jgi:hypothetical protein
MTSKPLNKLSFLSDALLGALVVCNEIDTAVELLKAAIPNMQAGQAVTFTTDETEALKLASSEPGRLVFTLGANEAVITF